MKKIILIFILFCSVFITQAQTSFVGTTTNSTGAVLNATVDTLNLVMSGDYNKVMNIQVVLTKTSGTIAGTVRLYGSNFNRTGTWDAVSDTLTLSNQSINKRTWLLTEPPYKYYRILQDGGTTMVGILEAKVVGLKPR